MLEKVIKEQSLRQLPSDINNDDKWECESVTLSLEEELSSPTLEFDKVHVILEREFQVPSLVENNELVSEEEPVLKTIQVEEKHPWMRIENVLVGIEDFNFPIDSFTFGMEEDRQVSSIGRPSIATSQVWIDAEHREMTFLAGEQKMKFNLHQNIPLTDEERKTCMKISHIKEHAPMFLYEDTLEGFELEANSFPTKELAFELKLYNMAVEKLILASDEDEEGVLAVMDEGPKLSSQTSPKGLAGL